MATIIDNETMDFVQSALCQGVSDATDFTHMVDDPVAFAQANYLYITANVADRLTELKQVRDSYGFYPDDPINQEVVSFLNKTVINGRYINEWISDPEYVAYNLGLYVSPVVINRIKSLSLEDIIDTTATALSPAK
jgi:hypothetical protein